MVALNFSFKDILKNIIFRHPKLKHSYTLTHPNTKYSLDLIIDEIIYVLKTGLSWRSIRSQINWSTLYWHYKRFVKHNIFQKLFKCLRKLYLRKVSSKTFIIDSSFILNKNGHNMISRNKFYKNKNGNKISIITDVDGVPLSVFINKGSVHDLSFIDKHIGDFKYIVKHNSNILLADKAYESKNIRNKLLNYNIQLMIPKKKNSITNYYFDKLLYKKRIIVENMFQKIKTFRRIMCRYDKLYSSYLSFVLLSTSIIIFKKL